MLSGHYSPASPQWTVNWLCLLRYAFFSPIPLLVTFVASDLKFGNTGPSFCNDFATFWTVSTVTDDVSWAPISAKFAPKQRLDWSLSTIFKLNDIIFNWEVMTLKLKQLIMLHIKNIYLRWRGGGGVKCNDGNICSVNLLG